MKQMHLQNGKAFVNVYCRRETRRISTKQMWDIYPDDDIGKWSRAPKLIQRKSRHFCCYCTRYCFSHKSLARGNKQYGIQTMIAILSQNVVFYQLRMFRKLSYRLQAFGYTIINLFCIKRMLFTRLNTQQVSNLQLEKRLKKYTFIAFNIPRIIW